MSSKIIFWGGGVGVGRITWGGYASDWRLDDDTTLF